MNNTDHNQDRKKIFLGMMSWQAGHGHIEETLKSIFDQTYSDFQLLIYDDCSPDDPTDKIHSLILDDHPLVFD